MELALGYQGGVGAFQKMAVNYGVTVADVRAEELKTAWRDAHPNIVQCWYDLENATFSAIKHRGTIHGVGPVKFRVAGSFLFMRLPSGRSISYPYPCVKDKLMPWGDMKPSICYQGMDSYTHKWGDQFAHGGLLFNNAVQGAARDVEAEAIIRVERAGYANVLSVHDEVICETKADFGSIAEFERLMSELPTWCPELPIAAKAWTAERYRKG
jgi:DNA polymerase